MRVASLTCLVGVAAIAFALHAAAPAQSVQTGKDDKAEVNVVLRISRKVISELTTKNIHRVDPVHLYVEDSAIDGLARTDATFSVLLDASPKESTFFLELKGHTTSTTLSEQPMVQIKGSGRMDFVVRKRVSFDGRKYTGESSTVDATFCVAVDALQTPRGLIGCIVELIATPKIRNSQPLVAYAALEDGKRKLIQTFDPEAAKLLEQLNEVSPLEKTITTLFPQTRDWIYYLSTTPTHLIVGAGPRGRVVPELPVSDNTQAPIEMWLREKQETKAMIAVIKLWKDAGKQLQALLPPELGKVIKTEDGFKTLTVKDWFVIQLGVGQIKGGHEEPGPQPSILKWRPAGTTNPQSTLPVAPPSTGGVQGGGPDNGGKLGNDIWRPVPKSNEMPSGAVSAIDNRITVVWRPVIVHPRREEETQAIPASGGGGKGP